MMDALKSELAKLADSKAALFAAGVYFAADVHHVAAAVRHLIGL